MYKIYQNLRQKASRVSCCAISLVHVNGPKLSESDAIFKNSPPVELSLQQTCKFIRRVKVQLITYNINKNKTTANGQEDPNVQAEIFQQLHISQRVNYKYNV